MSVGTTFVAGPRDAQVGSSDGKLEVYAQGREIMTQSDFENTSLGEDILSWIQR